MPLTTGPAPHLAPRDSVPRLMGEVAAALVPGIIVLSLQFGPAVLRHCGIAVIAAMAAEGAALWLRQRPIGVQLADGSAALTGLLLAIAVPPSAPGWETALGAAFAILLGKQAYGGLGQNPFNPAMLGYAALLISFPQDLTAWPASAAGLPPIDAVSQATPLDAFRTATRFGLGAVPRSAPADLAESPWAFSNLAFLGGGLWLMARRRIAWQIPCGVLAALAAGSLGLWLLDPAERAPPWFQLAHGATMLGAFFIATDPVTAAASPRGRLLYGVGIGVLILVIRTWGSYPDGVAFAVLLMNLAAPTIDRYTRPRIYGHGR